MNFVAQNFATVASVNAGGYGGLRGSSVGVEGKDAEVDAVEKRVVADAVDAAAVVVVVVVAAVAADAAVAVAAGAD